MHTKLPLQLSVILIRGAGFFITAHTRNQVKSGKFLDEYKPFLYNDTAERTDANPLRKFTVYLLSIAFVLAIDTLWQGNFH